MAFTLSIEGTDATTYGIYLSGVIDAWLASSPANIAFQNHALRRRASRSRYASYAPRQLVLPLREAVASLALSDREPAESWLKGFLGRDVRIQLDDGVSSAREITGTVLNVPMMPISYLRNPVAQGQFVMSCADPAWRDVQTLPLALSTTPATVPLHNAAVEDWTLELMSSAGTLTNPTVTAIDRGGATLWAATYTGALTTSQYLRVRAGVGAVELASGGSFTTVNSSWSGGFEWLDPWDGPALVLSATGGTPNGVLRYNARSW